jgi:GntR family transcriptional regulator
MVAFPVEAPARVESSSAVPLYHQVANVLQVRIFAGTAPPGALLGTEKELAAQFGVSRITIRRAIDILRRDGLLEPERGRGTFVSMAARPVGPTALHVFMDDILGRAEVLKVIELEHAEVLADANVAKRLGVRPGSKVMRLRRRMLAPDSSDSIWATYFITRDVWRKLDVAGRNGAVLPAVDRIPGLRLSQGREVIRAVAADQDTATLLDVDPGTAILRLERDYQTASGRTIVFGWVDRTHGAIPVLLSRAQR